MISYARLFGQTPPRERTDRYWTAPCRLWFYIDSDVPIPTGGVKVLVGEYEDDYVYIPDFRRLQILAWSSRVEFDLTFKGDQSDLDDSFISMNCFSCTYDKVEIGQNDTWALVRIDISPYHETVLETGTVTFMSAGTDLMTAHIEVQRAFLPDLMGKRISVLSMTSRDRMPNLERPQAYYYLSRLARLRYSLFSWKNNSKDVGNMVLLIYLKNKLAVLVHVGTRRSLSSSFLVFFLVLVVILIIVILIIVVFALDCRISTKGIPVLRKHLSIDMNVRRPRILRMIPRMSPSKYDWKIMSSSVKDPQPNHCSKGLSPPSVLLGNVHPVCSKNRKKNVNERNI